MPTKSPFIALAVYDPNLKVFTFKEYHDIPLCELYPTIHTMREHGYHTEHKVFTDDKEATEYYSYYMGYYASRLYKFDQEGNFLPDIFDQIITPQQKYKL